MFRKKCPQLHYCLSIFTIENQLDLAQIRAIVEQALVVHPTLADEIAAAFVDESVCWKQVLDDPELGEIYPAESEEAAREFAQQMLDPLTDRLLVN